MNTAELVRRMSSAGAPPEAIAIALDALEQMQVTDAHRRLKNSERMRRTRARTNAHSARTVRAQTEQTTTPSVPEPAPTATASKNGNAEPHRLEITGSYGSSSSLSGSPSEVQQRKEEQVERPKRSKTKTQLPQNFELPADWREFSLKAGMPEHILPQEFSQFCDHHWKLANRMADWFAAWRTWVRNGFNWRGKSSGTGRPPRPGSKEDQREKSAQAYRELCDYVEARSDDKGPGSGVGEEDAGVLPFPKSPRSENIHREFGHAPVRLSVVGGREGGQSG